MCRLPLLACALIVPLTACGGSSDGGGPPPLLDLEVTSLADNGAGTLRQALEDVSEGATITFAPPLAGGEITLFSVLEITKSVTIAGPDVGGRIVLDGNDSVRIFYLGDHVTFHIRSLHLRDGRSDVNAGAIFGSGDELHAQGCIFSGNDSGSHGGVLAAGGSRQTFLGCHFVGNAAEHGGALRLNDCDTRIEYCSFVFNTATTGQGGAIAFGGGQLIVRSTTMHGNTAIGGDPAEVLGGGALYLDNEFGDTHVGLYGSTLTGNQGPEVGGNLLAVDEVPANALTIDMRQTVLAEGAAPLDPDFSLAAGTSLSADYSLVGVQDLAGSVSDGVDGNQVGSVAVPADPMLDALTLTWLGTLMRPAQAGSPVRDAVPHAQAIDEAGAPLEFDQRLLGRLLDAAADIGAVENAP